MKNRHGKKVFVASIIALLALATGAAAQAALSIGGNQAHFGVHRLAPGFTPDPRVINVVSGGNIDVSTLNLGAGCTGWVTRQPDAIVHVQNGTSQLLRFFVRANGNGDTTLVINDARGNWHCNDDVSGNNLNPLVDIANAGPGQYDVWIGSYRNGEQLGGSLNITELQSQRP
ncbi:MAG: peptidase S1 [Polyangiaceae bacterium]|nr:peptidase S1 [Polyangiaceae bacterium]